MVRPGPGCKLVRGTAAKARMRPVGVVVRSPPRLAGERSAGSEHVLVQAFVPEAAVQALDEAVLHGLAWCDVVPLDPAIFLPLQDRARGQLGALVADHHEWPAAKAMSASSSRTTRWPESEVSTTSARPSRVKSSTMPARGNGDRRRAGPRQSRGSSAGSAAGAWSSAPVSRARACARHAGAPSAAPPDRAGTASCGSARCRPAAGGCAGAGSRTGAADPQGSSAAPGSPHRLIAARHSDRSSDRARSDHRPDAADSSSPRSPSSRTLSAIRASEVMGWSAPSPRLILSRRRVKRRPA